MKDNNLLYNIIVYTNPFFEYESLYYKTKMTKIICCIYL